MDKPLSSAQQEALAKVQGSGEEIRYHKGGFWTTPSTEFDERGIPEWSVSVQTLKSLARLGYFDCPDRNTFVRTEKRWELSQNEHRQILKAEAIDFGRTLAQMELEGGRLRDINDSPVSVALREKHGRQSESIERLANSSYQDALRERGYAWMFPSVDRSMGVRRLELARIDPGIGGRFQWVDADVRARNERGAQVASMEHVIEG